MQSTKLTIEGSYWDSLIYSGRLYLFDLSGAIHVVDWDALIDGFSADGDFDFSLDCAFRDSRYLYGRSLIRFFEDKEIRDLTELKFRRLNKRKLHVDAALLKKHTIAVSDSPIPFPHSDATLYMNTLYSASRSGVHASGFTVKKQLRKTKADRITDCPALALDASYLSLAIAAGSEGMFEQGIDSTEDPIQVSSKRISSCKWVYYSIYGSSYEESGQLVHFEKPVENDSGDSGFPRNESSHKVDKVIEASSFFDKEGYSFGSKDKIYLIAGGSLVAAKYSPHRHEQDPEKPLVEVYHNQKIGGLSDDIVDAGVASFGVVIQTENSLLVVKSDREIEKLNGGATRWRVFNRSKSYENQLHVIYADELEIRSFNHDYFEVQSEKLWGTYQSHRDSI